MLLQELLDLTVKNNASDLHLIPDISPVIRIDGELTYLTNYPKLSEKEVEEMIFAMVGEPQKELLINNKELDFSIDSISCLFLIPACEDLSNYSMNDFNYVKINYNSYIHLKSLISISAPRG